MVLISFKDETPIAQRQQIYDLYQTLAEECGGMDAGILYFLVAPNLDQRKNVHLVEIALFRSNEDLQLFRQHPKHTELTTILKDIADWQVGDLMTQA